MAEQLSHEHRRTTQLPDALLRRGRDDDRHDRQFYQPATVSLRAFRAALVGPTAQTGTVRP